MWQEGKVEMLRVKYQESKAKREVGLVINNVFVSVCCICISTSRCIKIALCIWRIRATYIYKFSPGVSLRKCLCVVTGRVHITDNSRKSLSNEKKNTIC